MRLRDGTHVDDRRLDRVYPGVKRHLSSLNFLVSDLPLNSKKFRSYTWTLKDVLDQGEEGRCVEFGLCHELLATPKPITRSVVDAIVDKRRIYWPAQQEDEWPGGSYPGADPVYEGTSVLSGTKVAARLGFYGEYRWAMNVEETALAVGHGGPVVVGVNWYEGFFEPDKNGWIKINNTSVAGGHCICVVGVKVVRGFLGLGSVNYDKSYFVLHNSWGPNWGQNGRCKVSWTDMARLISEEGEIMLPVVRNLVNNLP